MMVATDAGQWRHDDDEHFDLKLPGTSNTMEEVTSAKKTP